PVAYDPFELTGREARRRLRRRGRVARHRRPARGSGLRPDVRVAGRWPGAADREQVAHRLAPGQAGGRVTRRAGPRVGTRARDRLRPRWAVAGHRVRRGRPVRARGLAVGRPGGETQASRGLAAVVREPLGTPAARPQAGETGHGTGTGGPAAV